MRTMRTGWLYFVFVKEWRPARLERQLDGVGWFRLLDGRRLLVRRRKASTVAL